MRKHLKPEDAQRALERQNVLLIVGDGTRPRRPSRRKHSPRADGALLFECGDGGGLRQTIQGHVDQRGVAACCCGLRSCVESLPLRAPGLVDMDVGVDEAGQERVVAAVVGGSASAGSCEGAQTARIVPAVDEQALPAACPAGVTMRFERKACAII